MDGVVLRQTLKHDKNIMFGEVYLYQGTAWRRT